MTERPELHELRTATGIHSFVRYELAARLVAGKRVLDIACGNGFGTVILAEFAESVTGADVSEEAIATAQRTFARDNVTYKAIAPGPLPFAKEFFDVVVCLETIEHLPHDQQHAFLLELRRVLGPDGVIVLSTPDRDVERRYELATGAVNPWHLYTPRLDALDALRPLSHRRFYREADLVTTVVRPQGSESRPRFEGNAPAVTSPVAAVGVFAASAEQLRLLDAVAPIPLRPEPRLTAVDATMDALPARLRVADELSEQIRRVETALTEGLVPGSTAWWHRQAVYAFAAGISAGRRVLDSDAGLGHGAGRMSRNAGEVVAVTRGDVTPFVARALYPKVRFVESEPAAGNGAFDLVVCWSDSANGGAHEARVTRLLDLLAPTGIIITDVAPAGASSQAIEIVDCVGTCVVGDGPADLAGREGDWHGAVAPATMVAYAVARSASALESLRSAPSVALARGDFQREALLVETLLGRGVPDVGGFSSDERHDVFALLVSRAQERASKALEARFEEQAGLIASLQQRIELLEERRPLVTARSFLLRLQGMLKG